MSYHDDIGSIQGDFGSGSMTNHTAPVLSGALCGAIDASDVIRIYEGTPCQVPLRLVALTGHSVA